MSIKNFLSNYQQLNEISEDIPSRSARNCFLRFTLALDFIPKINTMYSSTKSVNVNKAYTLQYKLMDLWNVYEAVCKYGKELQCFNGKIIEPIESCGQILELKSVNLDDVNSNINQVLEKRPKIVEGYINHFGIVTDNENALWYKRVCSILKTNSQIKLSLKQVLALIYGERNAFYHGGEPILFGSSYSFRIMLLTHYIEILTEVISIMGAYFFNTEALNVSKRTNL